jgi:ATP-dependent protease HslVU (ClpYQ) peptidase subunit
MTLVKGGRNDVTTIVADREQGYMAADRRVTSNDGEVIMSCPTKIELVEVGDEVWLAGLCGLEGPGFVFLDWLENGDWDEPLEPMTGLEEEDGFSVLILNPEGLYVVDKFMRMTELFDRWYAVGTGGPFAWAVLKAGCGVEKAMDVAIEMDPHSGSGFDLVFLADVQP